MTSAFAAPPSVDGGAIIGAMALAYNVTELKQAERERSAEAARRRLILDVMNEAHVATDGDGRRDRLEPGGGAAVRLRATGGDRRARWSS